MASLLLLSAAPIVLVGCGRRPSAGSGREPEPFVLTATEDLAHRSSKHIRADDGGTVQTVDGQGTRYRLRIPARALLTDADIVLTPLSGIAGVPGQTMHYGVDIQPAGTHLYDLATLEITPTSPLPKDVYWLETEGPATRPLARPAFPAIGKPGMLVSHFSGGSVVAGGPETSAAVHVSGDGPGAAGSRSWLEWQRNVVQQDYQAGRIDKITSDTKNEIIDRRLQELAAQEAAELLERTAEEARHDLQKADSLAEHGDLKDAQAIHDIVLKGLGVERQYQLLGTETGMADAFGALFFKWYAALLRNCDNQHLDPRVLLGLERELQLLGYESQPGQFEKCAAASGLNDVQPLGSDDDDRSKRAARKEHVRRAADRVAAYASSIH